MSAVIATAHALRAVANQLPPTAFARLADELDAVLDLMRDVLNGSCRRDEVLCELDQLRTSMMQELHELSGQVQHALEEKAAELAQGGEPQALPAAPAAEFHRETSSRKAAEFNNAPVPKTSCKDTNKLMQELRDKHGWGFEKGGSHVRGYAPTGETTVISSTPSGTASRNQLADKIRRYRREETS